MERVELHDIYQLHSALHITGAVYITRLQMCMNEKCKTNWDNFVICRCHMNNYVINKQYDNFYSSTDCLYRSTKKPRKEKSELLFAA